MEATKLPLTTWFLAFYLVGQAKTGISSLALMRHLGVNYRTAWLVHNKIMQAMSEREEAYLLRGKVQIDDAYLGGERCGGKPGRGSENKVPIVAAVSVNEAACPVHVKLSTVPTFSLFFEVPFICTTAAIERARCSSIGWMLRAWLPILGFEAF